MDQTVIPQWPETIDYADDSFFINNNLMQVFIRKPAYFLLVRLSK